MDVQLLFPTAVVLSNHKEYLESAKIVIDERLKNCEKNLWNVCQSGELFDDRLSVLLKTIAKNSFEMLSEQGYDMTNKATSITEFWAQNILHLGQHAEHVHQNNAQITGFYFVDVPENSSIPYVFDPRYGKRQINMMQKNEQDTTYASTEFGFNVKPGDLMMFNSWLPHGFGRNQSKESFTFIHFIKIL